MLGIILTVTTTSEDVTTAEDCTCSGNSLPLQEHILPLLIYLTVRETRRDKYRIDLVYILFY